MVDGRVAAWAARINRGAFLAAPIVVLAAFVVDIGKWLEVPSEAAWRRAAEIVRRDFRLGDAVVVAPWWAEEARIHLAGLAPRRVERPAIEDYSPAERLWVVSAFHDGTIDALTGKYGARARELDQRQGGVRVARFAVPGGRVTYDFVARVRDARVAVRGRAGDQPCRGWGGGAWRCGGAPHMFFGALPREFDYSTYKCLWAHPPKEGALVATYERVLLGTKLVVRGGIANMGRRNRPGRAGQVTAPVLLQVVVGGQKVGEATFSNAESLVRVELDTSRFRGQVQPVLFAVSATTDEQRQFCMMVEARE